MNMGITVFLGILVGIVVVAQTLYTSAVEHVKEFGTVKAIGGSNWDIYRILGEQAVIAAVIGFALGGLMSLGMRPLMARLYLNVLISPSFAVAVFVVVILILTLVSDVDQKTLPLGVVATLVNFDAYPWGSLMAGALLGSLPVAFIYSFFVEHYVSGMTGSIKE